MTPSQPDAALHQTAVERVPVEPSTTSKSDEALDHGTEAA